MKLLNFTAVLTLGATLVALTATPASADVRVTIQDGLVTVVATDATVRQIIAEWARVGQAQVVNGERIPGGPISIELTDVPEAQALDMLLRSAAGYLAAPRAVVASNLSRFDRIVVMPTSNAPRTTAVNPSSPMFQQPQPQPQFIQTISSDDDPEEAPPAPTGAHAPSPNPRGPVFNAFPPPQVVNPQTGTPATGMPATAAPQGQAPGSQPTMQPYPTNPFGGVAIPGMTVPSPQQPGQPGQINAPTTSGQPRRPDGNDR
jgi:hypothetical protein